jgi:hypothetical protein
MVDTWLQYWFWDFSVKGETMGQSLTSTDTPCDPGPWITLSEPQVLHILKTRLRDIRARKKEGRLWSLKDGSNPFQAV